MEIVYQEVRFMDYCKTCKFKNLKDSDEPCNECLSNSVNENSHKPVKYEKGKVMKKIISVFDINKVKFDERYENDEYKTVTLYFIAPKEWLNGVFPEAIQAEISIEYPVEHPEAEYASAMMSPTCKDENGNFEDYDWFDIELTPSEIEAMINLAENSVEKEKKQ